MPQSLPLLASDWKGHRLIRSRCHLPHYMVQLSDFTPGPFFSGFASRTSAVIGHPFMTVKQRETFCRQSTLAPLLFHGSDYYCLPSIDGKASSDFRTTLKVVTQGFFCAIHMQRMQNEVEAILEGFDRIQEEKEQIKMMGLKYCKEQRWLIATLLGFFPVARAFHTWVSSAMALQLAIMLMANTYSI